MHRQDTTKVLLKISMVYYLVLLLQVISKGLLAPLEETLRSFHIPTMEHKTATSARRKHILIRNFWRFILFDAVEKVDAMSNQQISLLCCGFVLNVKSLTILDNVTVASLIPNDKRYVIILYVWNLTCLFKHLEHGSTTKAAAYKTVLVVFVGGCTHTEVNALRFIGKQLGI